MRITAIFGLLAIFVFQTTGTAQSEPSATVGASAYDIGRNGRDKLSLSLKFPVASGGQCVVAEHVKAIPVVREVRGNGRKAFTEVLLMADDRRSGSLSGLTEDEAKEFHRLFMTSFIIFLVVAIVAHFLAWQWRPWLPGAGGYASIMEDARQMAAYIPYAFMA